MIKMLITDCDGVLTDGGMYYSENGDEMKKFNTKDGMGFQILKEHNIMTAVVTGEDRKLVLTRSQKLQVNVLRMGIKDKLTEVQGICEEYGISLDEVAYIGDDINDLDVIRHVGKSFAPSDAMDIVKRHAMHVCVKKGGEGVVREVAELLIRDEKMVEHGRGHNSEKPLVSIMIPNYNHSLYLDGCIQSALNQTYDNVEIVVLDNSSSDESVRIASNYISQGVRVCRNVVNVMNRSYVILADMLTTGKYMMLLCADDMIERDFVETAVRIMERYPNVGYVQGEREFITEMGERLEVEPFYRCSFIAPGRNVMPIYMVTTVAHPSQGIFRREAFQKIGGYDIEVTHMNADRALWFYLSYVSDCAYVQKKMSSIRVGSQTETTYTIKNFQHLILSHLTIKDFIDFAREKKLENVLQREKEAWERLAKDFINCSVRLILDEDYEKAKRCLLYCQVIDRSVGQKEYYQKLLSFSREEKADVEYLRKKNRQGYQHKRNYEPPNGYLPVEFMGKGMEI